MVKLPFELFVGLRYLKAKRKHRFISFITFISLAGVALGVMALIVVLAVMSGFERDMKEKVIGINAALNISMKGLLHGYREVIAKAQSVPRVVSATPYIMGQIIIRGSTQARGVVVRGIDPAGEARTTALGKYMSQGTLLKNGPGVLIGEELARDMGFDVGDAVKLVSPVEVQTPAGPVPVMLERVVEGIFDSGMFEYDSSLVYVDLDTAQKLFRFPDAVHGVSVRVEDLEQTNAVRGDLNRMFAYPYLVTSWMEKNPNLFAAVRMEKKVMFIIVTLIVLVAALNIASTLIMVVMEKTTDIGILKAIGVRQASIMRIFTMEGAVIGVAGAMIGVVAGYLFAEFINPIADAIGWLTGFQLFRSDIYYLDGIPVDLSWARIAVTAGVAIGLSVLAAIYPAWKASRLDPVEALRYE
ncbi:MAG: lipoprotein-releasing ABC transporter permease subunit [Candidatus Aureabacteria bacterium]|nr:lipoprotein-releasing ABC transporter permease subunit [Candidatus Auribacterota bacterium]